jgi:hypothetical protein
MPNSEVVEHTGFWWDPARPEERWPGTLRISPIDSALLNLTKESPKNPFFDLPQYDRLFGETTERKRVTLLRCFHTHHDEILANAVIVGFHADDPDPLVVTVTAEIVNLDTWWGPSSVTFDHPFDMSDFVLRYKRPEPLIAHEDDTFTLTILSDIEARTKDMTGTIDEKIYLECRSREPRPFSELYQRVHACHDLLAVACLSVCNARTVTLYPPWDETNPRSRQSGTHHAPPIFRNDASRRPRSWPDLLFRCDDIRDKARDVFGSWLKCAEELREVRSLYLSGSHGSGFLEFKLLTLAQAAEAYHRRQSPNGLYLDPVEYEATVLAPLQAAIPKGINASLRQSLRNRLKYGNEISFRNRLRDLFRQHEPALAAVIEKPCRWYGTIADYRNTFTHHPVLEERRDLNHEEVLQCIYILRILLELCFLKSMGISGEDATAWAKRCYPYLQIQERFFPRPRKAQPATEPVASA